MNLSEIYKKLLTGEMKPEEASDIMKSPEIRSMVNSYIHKDYINKLVPYFETDLQNIYMIINITQFIYNNSGCETGLSDSEYDTLYAIMYANGGLDVISVPIAPTNSDIVYHKYPNLRGTLTKVFYLTENEERTNPSRKYLDEWKRSMEQKYFNNTGKHINLDNEDIYVFPKFDGVSGIFEMDDNGKIERVLTRGYTETNEAQNIIHQFKFMKDRKYHEFKSSYGLKTEIMMKEEDLEYFNTKYKTNYKNTRSIVSAIINSDEYDEEKSKLLHIVSLRVGNEDGLQELATEVFDYPYIRCQLKDREIIREFALKNRYVNDQLRCDGAVIYIINPDVQKALGRENNKNNYEVAYKFTEEVEFTKVKDVIFTMGLFGTLSPVAKVKPVKLKGNTIENVSLGSMGRFQSLGLRKGDKVKILYDIIPYLSFDDECEHCDGEFIEPPKFCPECGKQLDYEETDNSLLVTCQNNECPCRIKGKIINYLNNMNIDGISYGIIDKLYEYGFIKSIKDLYKLEKHAKEIAAIKGFGSTSVINWITSIKSHMDVYDNQVLGSIGINNIGKKTFEKILSHMSIDELIKNSEDKNITLFTSIPSIKEKTAIKLIDGINENKELIKFLQKTLNIKNISDVNNNSKYSVYFTKIRDKEKEQFVKNTGGIIDSSFTKSTTFLVVPSMDTVSSKVIKAKKYNTPIIHIDDLESKIEEYLKSK